MLIDSACVRDVVVGWVEKGKPALCKKSAFLLIFSIIAQHANISFSFPLCIFVHPSSSSLQPHNFLQVCPPLLRTSLVLFFIAAPRTSIASSYSSRSYAFSTRRAYDRPLSVATPRADLSSFTDRASCPCSSLNRRCHPPAQDMSWPGCVPTLHGQS